MNAFFLIALFVTWFHSGHALHSPLTRHSSLRISGRGKFSLNMKSIAVFGATGKTGKEAVYQALKKGYKVVALARDPSKLLYPRGSTPEKGDVPFVDPNLTVFKGSVTDPASVRQVFDVRRRTYIVLYIPNLYIVTLYNVI